MTASTPNSKEAPASSSRLRPLFTSETSTSGIFSQEDESRDQPPSQFLPELSAERDSFLLAAAMSMPAARPMPMLAPRAKQGLKKRDNESLSTTNNSVAAICPPSVGGTLLDIVSNMSLSDIRSTPAGAASNDSSLQLKACKEDSNLNSNLSSRKNSDVFEADSALETADWSLMTPETTKNTITTPQAMRSVLSFSSQQKKRKSPTLMHHATPVDGNRPLMLPSLNSTASSTSRFQNARPSSKWNSSTSSSQEAATSSKRAKNTHHRHPTSLLTSAPMLPSSPDLEDRAVLGTTAFFSPPSGVSMVNPNLLNLLRAPVLPPVAPTAPAAASRTTSLLSSTQTDHEEDVGLQAPVAAATLPDLDDHTEPTEPSKWLRMKRRQSLLTALRLAVGEAH